jgi:hypothetical protein
MTLEAAVASTPVFELYVLDDDLTREEVVDELAQVPERLRAILSGHALDALDHKSADDWSPIEVCRHMRDAVQVYGMRFKWMILDEDPFLPNYDEDRWVAEHPDGAPQIEAMLAEMASLRGETVRLLRALPPEGWLRTGRHEVIGPLQLGPYVRHELAHERGHLRQLEEALR